MKLYAQHGHAPADKMLQAAEKNFINGVILSPRYLKPDALSQRIAELRHAEAELDILMDPEFYATRYVGMPNCQLGYLEEWPHFIHKRRNELLVGSASVDATLRAAYEIQQELACSALIAPNVYVSSSLDSIEAAIAISFISRAQIVANEMGINIPVYATIALGRDSIVDRRNYEAFLNTITAIEPAPKGVYALIGAGPADEKVGTVRSEIIVADVIAGWMLLNYVLSLNGLEVVNGCSDILMPWLGVAGATAGATGWWSNLQVFAMGRYVRGSGRGQLPIVRYLSKPLLNRIKINEREAYAEVVPGIMNGLSTDAHYEGREPSRSEEALQTWESIASLNNDVISSDMEEGLENLRHYTQGARDLYEQLNTHGFSERYESNIEYLTALNDSVSMFKELAEL